MSCITVLHGIRQCLFPSCSQVVRLLATEASQASLVNPNTLIWRHLSESEFTVIGK
jgi:hypothetical protein